MKNITKKVQAYLSTFAPYLKTKRKVKKLKIILFLSENLRRKNIKEEKMKKVKKKST